MFEPIPLFSQLCSSTPVAVAAAVVAAECINHMATGVPFLGVGLLTHLLG